MADLRSILERQRKIIVLLADEAQLDKTQIQRNSAIGQTLFHEKLELQSRLGDRISNLMAQSGTARFEQIGATLDYVESDANLFDADRLAFREVLEALQRAVASDGSIPAVKLHKRIGEDLDALSEIERQYDKEISQIFSRFENRAIVLKREKWESYLAHVKAVYPRDQILKEYGFIEPYSATQLQSKQETTEIFGTELPPKTVALTFDDGPHPRFTEEITAILKQYGVPGTFFEVGRNLGKIEQGAPPKLGPGAEVSRKLIAEGFAVGNHSYTHAQLSKQTGEALRAEIDNTDTLLQTVDARRTPIFRFPYGARNEEAMRDLAAAHLRSVMWNIDSLDWADPVPNSIADRVLKSVDKEGRGIILFHDIQERTIKALPLVLDRLVADGYKFAGWDGSGFSVKASTDSAARSSVTTGYATSWAIVIGINDYAHWPKLQYAVNDANAVRRTLVDQFGFASDHVLLLTDAEATRTKILAAFHDHLWHNQLQRNDRVFVFFSGHGATRHLSSGRDVGYLIPVESDPNEIASDAIAMTEIQNIAESLDAKHVLFVMDACYSGLGLARGGSGGYLRENARRIGRQMLTAGGADQVVADGGPDGHSVFTWALLQGLSGKADLNGDGLITATELAAYIAPAVANASAQTPAFGSLPGSQGGDFVFELPTQSEFLSADSGQLSSAAIALNSKLDAPRQPELAPVGATPEPAAVKVRDLQGKDQVLAPPPAVNQSVRQRAQRANDLGLQFYKEKQYDKAEAAFTEALKLRPDFALAANNLGFIYYKQDRFAEAARWFENTIHLDPSRAITYLNLGDAYAKSGESKRAGQAYRTYLELAPNGSNAEYVHKQLESL